MSHGKSFTENFNVNQKVDLKYFYLMLKQIEFYVTRISMAKCPYYLKLSAHERLTLLKVTSYVLIVFSICIWLQIVHQNTLAFSKDIIIKLFPRNK